MGILEKLRGTPFPGGRLTTKVEKRILEISQSTTDLWKTDFRAKNHVGLKIFKTAKNGVTKRINDTASILFFTRVREKGQKSRRFEKIACEPSLGAGTERQSQRTKIPVRGLKLFSTFSSGSSLNPVRVPKSPEIIGLLLGKRSLCHRGTETYGRGFLLISGYT